MEGRDESCSPRRTSVGREDATELLQIPSGPPQPCHSLSGSYHQLHGRKERQTSRSHSGSSSGSPALRHGSRRPEPKNEGTTQSRSRRRGCWGKYLARIHLGTEDEEPESSYSTAETIFDTRTRTAMTQELSAIPAGQKCRL